MNYLVATHGDITEQPKTLIFQIIRGDITITVAANNGG